MHKYPNVSQKLILRAQNKVLTLKYDIGTYGFPGGRMEWGEELFPALQRELKEELNFTLKKQPRLFHVYNFTPDKSRHSVKICYIMKIPKPLNLISPEGHEVFWFTQEELNQVYHHPDFVKKIFAWRDPGTRSLLNFAR
jgi:ADP-ribose pyrophosphatase YjhB (NUDIX family)